MLWVELQLGFPLCSFVVIVVVVGVIPGSAGEALMAIPGHVQVKEHVALGWNPVSHKCKVMYLYVL